MMRHAQIPSILACKITQSLDCRGHDREFLKPAIILTKQLQQDANVHLLVRACSRYRYLGMVDNLVDLAHGVPQTACKHGATVLRANSQTIHSRLPNLIKHNMVNTWRQLSLHVTSWNMLSVISARNIMPNEHVYV
jgi:hypothetical protein